ncbi:unnamed protein product [Vitrella brassicaformis CCMP3155]|uniref:Sushi domain-containing protein n=2 Tax=Vitrella brassicaformis TaxID=1169539 RepID=A0A0G4EKV7_VITBC|nr:unnamed protein product [Vitrella brassicaformis CCMP3155]|eukprot:CEL97096.1 unnamed protein product [Vitrella brassicaformis CCMP3155]
MLICMRNCAGPPHFSPDYTVSFPHLPSGGEVPWHHGAEVNVTCSPGRTPDFHSTVDWEIVRCLDGFYTEQTVRCKRPCPAEYRSKPGYVVSATHPYPPFPLPTTAGLIKSGVVRDVRCASHQGFYPVVGQANTTVSCEEGAWSFLALVCRRACPLLYFLPKPDGTPPSKSKAMMCPIAYQYEPADPETASQYITNGTSDYLLEGGFVDWNAYPRHKTEVKLKCRSSDVAGESWHPATGLETDFTTIKCINGSWSKIWLRCAKECTKESLLQKLPPNVWAQKLLDASSAENPEDVIPPALHEGVGFPSSWQKQLSPTFPHGTELMALCTSDAAIRHMCALDLVENEEQARRLKLLQAQLPEELRQGRQRILCINSTFTDVTLGCEKTCDVNQLKDWVASTGGYYVIAKSDPLTSVTQFPSGGCTSVMCGVANKAPPGVDGPGLPTHPTLGTSSPATIYCEQGNFTAVNLSCRRECGAVPLDPLRYVFLLKSGFPPGASNPPDTLVYVACKEGYTSASGPKHGKDVIKWNDGIWTQTVLDCKADCGEFPLPQPVVAYNISGEGQNHGDKRELTCAEGYSPGLGVQIHKTTLYCENGQWQALDLACYQNCPRADTAIPMDFERYLWFDKQDIEPPLPTPPPLEREAEEGPAAGPGIIGEGAKAYKAGEETKEKEKEGEGVLSKADRESILFNSTEKSLFWRNATVRPSCQRDVESRTEVCNFTDSDHNVSCTFDLMEELPEVNETAAANATNATDNATALLQERSAEAQPTLPTLPPSNLPSPSTATTTAAPNATTHANETSTTAPTPSSAPTSASSVPLKAIWNTTKCTSTIIDRDSTTPKARCAPQRVVEGNKTMANATGTVESDEEKAETGPEVEDLLCSWNYPDHKVDCRTPISKKDEGKFTKEGFAMRYLTNDNHTHCTASSPGQPYKPTPVHELKIHKWEVPAIHNARVEIQ